MENIFEILVRNAINERLDDLAKEDEKYKELDHKMDEAIDKWIASGLSEEQNAIISQMADASAALSSQYTVLAYKLAVNDTIELLKDIGIIGRRDISSNNVDK